jgi:hypothetical protein
VPAVPAREVEDARAGVEAQLLDEEGDLALGALARLGLRGEQVEPLATEETLVPARIRPGPLLPCADANAPA